MLRNRLLWAALLSPVVLGAQSPELAAIAQRLDRLESQNRALLEEVRALRAEVAASREPAGAGTPDRALAAAPPDAAPPAGIEERLEIQERRTEEQAQTKIESSQRLPIKLAGMALFNAYWNSRQSGGSEYPALAAQPGAHTAGATLRQTIAGLEFRGPSTVWGGRVHGSVYMDFFGSGANREQVMRLRTGSIRIDWKNRSIMAGLEKPIFNPREPSSLAQVGVSPLTGAGNLWLWLPQAAFEQDLRAGEATGVRARIGAVQTREIGPYAGSDSGTSVEPARPGVEGRFEFFHNFDDERRVEIAPGFHASTTHAGGASIPSSLFSLDWFFNPWRRVEFTGAFYTGQNVAHLGTGGIRQGYSVYGGYADAIKSRGGWGQVTIHALRRVDLHLFTGQHDDRNAQLVRGSIGKNLALGGNVFYRLAPNVILALEGSQFRTSYIGQGVRINNHYDLALAYLF
jgi:hypothetical protein